MFLPSLIFAQDKVFVDPGHGGHDSGAVSFDNQLKEKDLNLETAKACIEELEKYGVKVYTSRTDDVFITSDPEILRTAISFETIPPIYFALIAFKVAICGWVRWIC